MTEKMKNMKMIRWAGVLTIINGKNQKQVLDANGCYPIYGSGGVMGYANDYLCKESTVIIGRKGNINSPIFVQEKFWNVDTAFGLSANRKLLDPKFLYYFCIQFDFERLNTTVTIPSLTKARLLDIKIPLPPLPEQQRIAEILDLADAARRKRRENLTLYDDLIRSLFLKTFGDPVSNPMGWETKKLGELVSVDAPMVDPRQEKYLDFLHIGPDRIEKETGGLLPALTAREDKLISGKFLFDDRYVLYSKIRPYLRKVALPSFTGLCSADVYPVRPLEGLLTREFLWQLLLGNAFLKYTQSLPSRASIPKLNRKELATYVSIKPPIDLQNQFAEQVQEINAQKTREQALYEQHDDLFNALLQRAFKGEL